MGHIFMSYSNKKKEEAILVKEFLESHNLKTWMALGSIPAGKQYA